MGEDGVLRLWDALKGTQIKAVELGTSGSGVAWVPGGGRLLAQDHDAIHLVDAKTLRKIHHFGRKSGGGAKKPSMDPEVGRGGALVASGSAGRTARVWEIATRRLVAELPHDGPVLDVAFSPDGRFLVTAATDAPTIWDLESRRALVQLVGHKGLVGTVDFSPDGGSVLSGADDRSIRIWRCEVCAPVDQVSKLARSRLTRKLTAPEREQFLHERD